MIPYIIKAAMILAGCLLFYKLLLQKETFFRLNRYVFQGCLLLAFLLPLVPVPQQWSFRKAQLSPAIEYTSPAVVLPGLLQSGERQGPTTTLTKPAEKPFLTMQQAFTALWWLYWFGVAVFAIMFLVQLGVLLYQAYTSPVIKDGPYRIVEVRGNKAPCSFGNNIFINPEKYDWDTYNQILMHEKVHIRERHTLDLLLAEIVLIFQWFNPFAWLLRKELENNLEFLTDSQLLEKEKIEQNSYQMNLLKVSAPQFPLSLTTNYNQSLLKKRLVMMNAKKSNIHTTWKYLFLLPLLMFFASAFNEPITMSGPVADPVSSSYDKMKLPVIDTEGLWFATIKGDKISMQFRKDDDEKSYNGNTFLVSEFGELPKGKEGSFKLVREAGTITFTGRFDGEQGMGRYKFTSDKAFEDEMKKQGIDISNERDLMSFFLVDVKKSYVQMLKGHGYTSLTKNDLIPLAALKVDESYIKSINQAGFEKIGLKDLVPFKALGINGEYIREVRNAGYPNISVQQLISFKAQGIDAKYIADMAALNKPLSRSAADADDKGKEDKIKPEKEKDKSGKKQGDDIVSFKALGVNADYINSIKEVVHENISNQDLIAMKANNVTADYIKSFESLGYKLSAGNIVSFKALGVTPDYIKGLQSSGNKNLKIDDIIGARANSVSEEFIKGFQAAGFPNLSLNKAISFKALGITPAYIRGLEALGFKNMSPDDIMGARAMGVSEEFIRSFQSVGYSNITLSQATSLKALSVSPAFIKTFQDLGYKSTPIEIFFALKALRVTPAIVQEYRTAWYADVTLEEVADAYGTKTTTDVIRDLKQKGYDLNAIRKYVKDKSRYRNREDD